MAGLDQMDGGRFFPSDAYADDRDIQAPALTAAHCRRSSKPEALTSLEDHKPYKQLRRHLTTRGMAPAEYRGKWGLPADYPMVAAGYSAARSALAKAAGLGKKRQAPPVEMAAGAAHPRPPSERSSARSGRARRGSCRERQPGTRNGGVRWGRAKIARRVES